MKNSSHLIGQKDGKSQHLSKNIPHLYPKIWGFGKVFWRIIYSLFTEIVLTNKKCTFRCMAKKVRALSAQTPIVLFVTFDWQKKCYSHQPHAQAEAVGKGITLGDAVHLIMQKLDGLLIC